MFLLLVVIAVSATLIIGGRKTLKPLFHLLSVLLALPSILFALACLVLQRAVSHDGLLGFIDTVCAFILAMLPWGAVVLLVCFVILIAAGFQGRWRRLAASVMIALIVGSAAVMHVVAGLPDDSGQWWLFLPGLLSLLVAACLFVTGRPSVNLSVSEEIVSRPYSPE